jgi:hypothetical protein
MVSSAINMDLDELLEALERFRVEYADAPDYQGIRSALPADWPL